MWPRTSLLFAAVLLFGFAVCDSSEKTEEELVPTKLSTFESFIVTLLKPVEAVENTVSGIGKGIKDIASHIPGLKNIVKDDPNKEGKEVCFGDILNPIKDSVRAIYPGTNWCGDGDIAKNEDDLGFFNQTDACCRAHDNCKGGIPAKESRHGLLNIGTFTRSPCECDEEFYRCLKEVKGYVIAQSIGATYFNLLAPQCFKEEYPIINCKKYAQKVVNEKCLEHNLDYTKPKKWQWFNTPDFF